MIALPVTPLLAAGIDWLDGLLPLAFVAFWIVSQIINVIRSVSGGGGQQPAGGGRRRPPAPPRPPRPAADPRADLERQIDEFLRGPRPPRPEPARSPTPPLPKAGTDGPRLARPIGSLEGTSAVSAHVHDAFDHELGHLHRPSTMGTVDTDASPPPRELSRADEIAMLLRSPATVRQLVVLREVLERPVTRW
ncbi:MAG: hypothetical protein ACKOC8_07795 [Pirellulales bacterium]